MMQKIDTKNKIYIGLCILYLLLSIINAKHPIKNIFLDVAYLSTWGFILLWESINRFVYKRGNYDSIIIVLIILIISIVDVVR